MGDILPELNGKDYIDSLSDDYSIHFCKQDEIEDLVGFLNQYWRKNHIFVLSRPLLDWQHYDADNHRYNFVLARNRSSGEIHSILGFVPSSHFDKAIENLLIWPCIWKSRDDVHRKGLGVSLYYYLKNTLPIETISILGISETALSIYRHWNFSTGRMAHYYLPNPDHEEVLSSSREYCPVVSSGAGGWSTEQMSAEEYNRIDRGSELFRIQDNYKSKDFYINRYIKHPVYRYIFFSIADRGEIKAVIVARECGARGSVCLRIVDYIGRYEYLAQAGLSDILRQRKYEYIDMLTAGFPEDVLLQAGFIRKGSNTVIPNYFEPFLKENIELDYAYKSIRKEYIPTFFKADADQDRPNVL